MSGTCIVCRSGAAEKAAALGVDGYWRCATCGATFLDPARRPSRSAEFAHYLHHENDPADPRYRRFLSKLSDPLLARLAPQSRGLDYGCGPGPALAHVMSEAGHGMRLYDPFFAPDQDALEQSYDFITCSETAEHFHAPAAEFDRFDRMLRPGGWLGVMTCFQTDDARFADWHYRKDPTHVVFYREGTFDVLAAQRDWTVEIPVKDVVLFQKGGG